MSYVMDETEEGINIDNTQHDLELDRDSSTQQPAQTHEDDGDLLGLDKPIKLKTRAKIAKVDNQRIFNHNGIPLLVKTHSKLLRTLKKNDKNFYSEPRSSISKSQKFEHEYENLSSVLQFYQLWCHGLFPKATFKDCIHLIRALGARSPQLRLYRRELIAAELHKLKVAKGIIADENQDAPSIPEEENTTDPSNEEWNSMHMSALVPADKDALSTDDKAEQTNAITSDTHNNDVDSDDPFSDDDDINIDAHTENLHPASGTQHQDRPKETTEENEDLELELMREYGA
ncbi:Replication Fork Protection Component Swi3 family protein [Candida albicans]|uniref:Chromosome segregation in meiosis protein n=1 Tax=Candida albicans TaxID=5476 RepID=A0A8H6BW95_CANAX|nr:Replication Fork Protection Component Swi3 family protein [Candida albicans]